MAEVDNPNLIKVIPKADDTHLPPSPISELQYTADGKLDGCADDINIYASNPESASDGTASEHSSSDGECSASSRSSRSRSSSYYSSSGDERSDRHSRGKRPASPKGSPRPVKKASPPPRKPSPTGSDSRKRKASPSPSKPLDSGNNLPRVSAELKERLLDHAVHIDMADLLPGNSARGRGDSPNKGFNNSRREPIASFALWTRAYSVFMAYRTYNHPELVIPMLKYLDLIGLYADPGKGYRLEQWLDYDHYFRRYATSHPDDASIWAVRHEESYLRCMAPASGNDRQSVAPPSVAIANGYREPASGYNRESGGYNREVNSHNREPNGYNRESNGYHQPNGYSREPSGYSREANGYNGYREPPPIVIKPRDVEVCLRFNRGNCTTPCIRKRSHVCMKCGGTGHGKYICNKVGNPAFGRGRNMR